MENNLIIDKHDFRFDILKSIALVCIILAHVSPPRLVFFVRNFDVPLMVLISGAVFFHSAALTKIPYGSYLKKRILRLVKPTWLFLSFMFLSIFFAFRFFGKMYPFSAQTIVDSFFFRGGNDGGIGYVWIIKVFLLNAIIAHVLLKLFNTTKNLKRFLTLIFLIYVSYELLYFIYANNTSIFVKFFLKDYIFNLLPYGCLFGLGICLPSMKRIQVFYLIIIFLFIFLTCFISLNYDKIFHHFGHFVITQSHKDPPRIYYLSYALFVSLGCYWSLYSFEFKRTFFKKIINFLSKFSLQIYLCHIYLIFWCKQSYIYVNNTNCLVRFLIIFISSCFLVWSLEKIRIRYLENRKIVTK